jgi:hypothetical protein
MNTINNPYYSLDELIGLCLEKNYSEIALGIRDQPGFVAERFRRGHEIMVLRSTNAKYPKNFTMVFPTTSYNEQDRMQLKFNLDYNPIDDTLRLRGITAFLNPTEIEGKRQSESQKIFILTDTRRLPDSKEIYAKLTEHRTQEAQRLYNKITTTSLVQKTLHV